MAKATNTFKKAVAKAKGLYRSGRFKTFADAVKAAYKKVAPKKRVTKTRTRKVKRKKTSAKRISGPFPSRRRNVHANTMGSMPKHESFLGIADATLKKELRNRMTVMLGQLVVKKEKATTKRERKELNGSINSLRKRIVEFL